MIFNELYSAYYNTIAAIISEVIDGEPSEKELQAIVAKRAFGESVLTIMPALKSERWQLLRPDMTTTLRHKPTMPLTTLQKQWLKAISLDPRIRLFGVELKGLEDVEPLFTADDYHIYDRYDDGDPFENEEYQKHFEIVLSAIRKKTPIRFEMVNRKGNPICVRCRPIRLEYSEKDDKFRVITAGCRYITTVNLARITSCAHETEGKGYPVRERKAQYDTLTLRVLDERNALERVMLHFSHFEKQAEKIDEKQYLLKIKYAHDDEAEMVIRVLSFGALVEVVESEAFKNLIVEKLKKQKDCGLV